MVDAQKQDFQVGLLKKNARDTLNKVEIYDIFSSKYSSSLGTSSQDLWNSVVLNWSMLVLVLPVKLNKRSPQKQKKFNLTGDMPAHLVNLPSCVIVFALSLLACANSTTNVCFC